MIKIHDFLLWSLVVVLLVILRVHDVIMAYLELQWCNLMVWFWGHIVIIENKFYSRQAKYKRRAK